MAIPSNSGHVKDVEDILITSVLSERPPSKAIAESNTAFVSLANIMAEAPEKLPQALCNIAMELCGAETSGISLLRQRRDGEAYFYWEALAGIFEHYVGGTTARDFSPCGTTLDRAQTQLFLYPGRLYTYLDEVSPRIVEGLVVPFYAAGQPLGTIWIVSHHDEHRFDAGHALIVEQIAAFCGAAFHLLSQKNKVEAANVELASQAELLISANTLTQNSLQQVELANLALRESNKVKDEFVSLVSHELRGPVTTIVGYAKLLLSHGSRLSSVDFHQGLESIEEESMRLNRIIKDLLILARPENGGPAEEPVDVCDAVQDMIEEHQKWHPHRSIQLDGESERSIALASSDYLGQIVRNLISNAEKYSPLDQAIRVLVKTVGTDILVTVEDNGAGVSPDEIESIFESFYRSPVAQQQASGIGIGLTVCKRLVEAQGGRIWVEASAGRGARFCFTLPACHPS